MAGKIEIRTSGERFRFVVLNRSGEKLLRARRLTTSRARASRVFIDEGCERCRDHRRNHFRRRWDERQQSPRRREGLNVPL